MEIWPAIDLCGGKCVRLQQGDFTRQTVFGDDPAVMAQHWVSLGADRLHLVDLDGARAGGVVNWESLKAILRAVGVPCQLGGGIRSEQTIREALELGLARLVVGTQAIHQPEWFRQMCRRFPGRLVVGIDARDGRVATHGWTQTTPVDALELAKQFDREPIAAIVYTDIATDGMLAGPNLPAMTAMQNAVQCPVIASGGVSTVEDVARLARAGLAGCIIGRALYEGTLALPDAIRAAQQS